jgi:hypothetical protein
VLLNASNQLRTATAAVGVAITATAVVGVAITVTAAVIITTAMVAIVAAVAAASHYCHHHNSLRCPLYLIVACCKPMPLKEEFPLQYLYGEATFLVKVSKVGCHQKVLIVLWGHTHSFG